MEDSDDKNNARLVRLERILEELSETVKRIDESNDTVKIQINSIQNNINKVEDTKNELQKPIDKIKNNIFLLENL